MSEPVTTGPSDPQEPNAGGAEQPDTGDGTSPRPKRRRGSRGGRNRSRNRSTAGSSDEQQSIELPERAGEGADGQAAVGPAGAEVNGWGVHGFDDSCAGSD